MSHAKRSPTLMLLPFDIPPLTHSYANLRPENLLERLLADDLFKRTLPLIFFLTCAINGCLNDLCDALPKVF